jgi:hypothetical protein
MSKTTTPSSAHDHEVSESDAGKGAVESDQPVDPKIQPTRGGPLGDDGLPKDKTAICEDAIGANVDESQG